MTTEIQKVENTGGELTDTIGREKIVKYLQNMGQVLQEHHAEQFIEIAQAFNLNPFKREIYGIQYGNNFNIIVGYEVYLKRGDRSGLLDGWKVWTEGTGKEMVAKILIHRKDRKYPFEHEVDMVEYDQGNSMWKKKGKTMIKKVVTAQGFRLCFPNEYDGLPYIAEEIGEIGTLDAPAPIMVENNRDSEATPEAIAKIKELLDLINPKAAQKIVKTATERDWKYTQDEAEKIIAPLTSKARKYQESLKTETDAKQAQEQQTSTDPMQDKPDPVNEQQEKQQGKTRFDLERQMHAIGNGLYKDQWAETRLNMVKQCDPNKASSKDLTDEQIGNIIYSLQQVENEANQQQTT